MTRRSLQDWSSFPCLNLTYLLPPNPKWVDYIIKFYSTLFCQTVKKL